MICVQLVRFCVHARVEFLLSPISGMMYNHIKTKNILKNVGNAKMTSIIFLHFLGKTRAETSTYPGYHKDVQNKKWFGLVFESCSAKCIQYMQCWSCRFVYVYFILFKEVYWLRKVTINQRSTSKSVKPPHNIFAVFSTCTMQMKQKLNPPQ